jgi:hypothetical protein
MDSYKCDRFVFFLRQLMECYCTQLNFETEINSYKIIFQGFIQIFTLVSSVIIFQSMSNWKEYS